MWLTCMFLDCFNGIIAYKIIDLTKDFEFELFTDSAWNTELGYGTILQKQWTFMRWPGQDSLRTLHFLN